MKNTALTILLLPILIFACKREKMEPVVEKQHNDTTIVNPQYWCVKSIIYNKYENYQFEYDANSNLVKSLYFNQAPYPYLDDTIITTYEYNQKNLVLVKKFNRNTLIYLESRNYNNGKIDLITINKYGQGSSEPIVTRYIYNGNTVKTLCIGPDHTDKDTISKTVCTVYPDSSVADILFLWNGSTFEPMYHYKETLLKKSDIITLQYKSAFNAHTDSIYLLKNLNNINPEIWNVLDFEKRYVTYSYYQVKSVILNRDYNPCFISRIISNYIEDRYNYVFDKEGRVTSIALDTSANDRGPIAGSPTEPRHLTTSILFYY